MANRPPDSPMGGEEPGTAVVLRALRALHPPVSFGDIDEACHLAVSDLLMDHADRLDGAELLYCMTAVMTPPLDEIAAQHCEREYLLVDPILLAEDAIANLYTSHRNGNRIRPFRAWADRVTRYVAQRATTDRSLLLYRPGHHATRADHITSELAWLSNQLPLEGRRIAWLAYREQRAEPEIAEITGYPFERVEFFLNELLMRAIEAIVANDTADSDRDASPPDGLEEEGDDGLDP